jgi:hypothetical protein
MERRLGADESAHRGKKYSKLIGQADVRPRDCLN